MPNGETAYMRSGNLHTDATGNLVTSDGNALQPGITIPSNATTISLRHDGTVSVTLPGQTNAQPLGTIQLAQFANPSGLNSIGGNLFLPTAASGDPVVGTAGGSDGLGKIQQGALQASNVSVVEACVGMILAARSSYANSKAVQTPDQMFQQLNTLGR